MVESLLMPRSQDLKTADKLIAFEHIDRTGTAPQRIRVLAGELRGREGCITGGEDRQTSGISKVRAYSVESILRVGKRMDRRRCVPAVCRES